MQLIKDSPNDSEVTCDVLYINPQFLQFKMKSNSQLPPPSPQTLRNIQMEVFIKQTKSIKQV